MAKPTVVLSFSLHLEFVMKYPVQSMPALLKSFGGGEAGLFKSQVISMQLATIGRSEPPLPFGHLPLHEVEKAKAPVGQRFTGNTSKG